MFPHYNNSISVIAQSVNPGRMLMSHLGFLSAHLDLYSGAGLGGDGGARGAGHGDADLDKAEKIKRGKIIKK